MAIQTPDMARQDRKVDKPEPQRQFTNQARPQRRPFLNPTGKKVVFAGEVALAVALGAAAANATRPNQAPLLPPAQLESSGIYQAPDVLKVEIPSKPEELKGVEEIYTGTYEISKGVTIRDGRNVLHPNDIPNPGSGIIIDWDSIDSIEGVPLNGSDRFLVKYAEIGFGYDPKTGSPGNGLWHILHATLENGDEQILNISLAPSGSDFLKAVDTGQESLFVPLNSDGRSVRDPIAKIDISSSEFNQITIPPAQEESAPSTNP